MFGEEKMGGWGEGVRGGGGERGIRGGGGGGLKNCIGSFSFI